MRFYYGSLFGMIGDKPLDVTEILFREGGKINQPYNSLFGDPTPCVRKTLFWVRDGKDTIEFDEDQPISLNINRHEVIWNYEKLKQKRTSKYMIRTGPCELEDLSEDFYNLMVETKETNPEYQQVYFSDLDCLLFIRENYPQYLPEYEVLVPGKYREDLFLALFLYKYGGVYNDLGHKYLLPVAEIIGNEAMVFEGIYNSFMASLPEEPLLFCYIELMVKRIRERIYTDSPLGIWDAFCMHYNYSGPSFREINRYERIKIIHREEEEMLYDNDKPVIETLYKNKEYYADVWQERKVYKTTYGIWNYKTLKEKYSYSGQGIPKIMIRTHRSPIKDLINPLYLLIKKTEEDNPEYQQVYFDDQDCLSFIEENFPQYLPEYNALIPGAYKADLFRALFLYKYGGIYNDIAHEYLALVDEIIGNNRMVLTNETWFGKWGIYNAFMACQPEEELIKVYIELIIERIRSRSYGCDFLDITGPHCFWDAFVKYFNHPPEESIRELEKYKWIKFYYLLSSVTYVVNKQNQRLIRKNIVNYYQLAYPDKKDYYQTRWHNRTVYAN